MYVQFTSCVYLDAYMMCVSQQVNVRQLVEAEILTCIEQLQHSAAFYIETCYVQVNPFQSSSTFQIEPVICCKEKNVWFLFEIQNWSEIQDIAVKSFSDLYISYF